MTEKGFWNKVRRAFKGSRASLAWHVQDIYRSGMPDLDVIVMGHTAKIELKYADRWPPRGGALKTQLQPGQRRHLMEWADAGGNAFVLLGVGKVYYLLDPTLWAGAKFYKETVESYCVFSGVDLRNVVEWVANGCPMYWSEMQAK